MERLQQSTDQKRTYQYKCTETPLEKQSKKSIKNLINKKKHLVISLEPPPLSPTSGRVEGEVKLSVSYRNSTLFIMVMHIRDLVRAPTASDLTFCPMVLALTGVKKDIH